MIARPQIDILNMLPVTQVSPLAAKALDNGFNVRFDAALLEAAKAVRDGVNEKPELVLNPRIRQALENALGELSQKPLNQLKTLAEAPQAARPEIAAIVAKTAEAFGLNAEEKGMLKEMLPLALPQVLAYKTQQLVPGSPVDGKRNDGEQPGPQGGTPVRAASPADRLIADGKPDPRPVVTVKLDDPQDSARRELPGALAQGIAVPVLVSTRTDDGSSRQGPLTMNRVDANEEIQAPAPVNPGGSGRVIQVLSSETPETGEAKLPPVQARTAQAGPAPTAPVSTRSAAPQGADEPLEIPTAAPQAKASQVKTATVPEEAPIQGARRPAAAATPERPVPLRAEGAQRPGAASDGGRSARTQGEPKPQAPVEAGRKPSVDVEFVSTDSDAPVPVKPESVVTLKEDGTWVLPKEAPQASRASAPPTAAPEAPVKHAQPGSDSALRTAAAKLQGTTQEPSTPAEAVPTPPSASTGASRTESGAPAPAPQTGKAAPAPQAPAAVPAANEVRHEAMGLRPAAEAPVYPTTADVPVQAPASPTTVPREVTEAGKGDGEVPAGAKAAAETLTAEGVQFKRPTSEGNFGGLAQFGQDPVKALAQQTARAYALRESVFKQVSEALRDTPPTESGRMKIQLHPSELGVVTIDLVMVDGKLSARLVASQGEVRDAFVRDLPGFKAGLESQGVVVRDISVAVRGGVADQQQQPPRQPVPQPWRFDSPRASTTPNPLPPLNTGYAAAFGAKNERFSALA